MQSEITHYKEVAAYLLNQAKVLGVDQIALSISGGQGLSISMREQTIESTEFEDDKRLSIVLYKDNKKGSVSTNVFNNASLNDCLDKAITIAKYSEADEYYGLAETDFLALDYPDLGVDFSENEPVFDELVSFAQEMDDLSSVENKDLKSEGSHVNQYQGFRIYANSNGMLGYYSGTSNSASVSMLAHQDGMMEQSYWYDSNRDWKKMASAQSIRDLAIEHTLQKLNAVALKSMQVPVIFAPNVAKSLFGPLMSALSGRSQYLQNGFLVDALDTMVFPEWFSMNHQPHLIGEISSVPFDGDGVATQPQTIVNQGRIEQYILNAYSARRLGMAPNGCASGLRNIRLVHPQVEFSEMLKQAGKGVYITELMGQGVNSMTGDLSCAAKGLWFEQGELKHAVSNFTIAGNLKDIYKNLIAIANDTDSRGNLHCGSVLVEGLTLAGV